MNDSETYLYMFPIKRFGVETNPAKLAWNVGSNIWQNIAFRSHISAIFFCRIQDL